MTPTPPTPSLVNHPAARLLLLARTSSGLSRRALVTAMAAFSGLQVALAWALRPLAWLYWLSYRRKDGRGHLLLIGTCIGDNVLAIPAIQALRAKYPDHTITLIVRPVSVGFSQLLPREIDREIPFHYSTTPLSRLFEPARALRFVMRNRLSAETAINLSSGTDGIGAAFIAFFSLARRRASFSEKDAPEKNYRNWLYDSLYTQAERSRPGMHETEKVALLIERVENVRPSLAKGALGGADAPVRARPPGRAHRTSQIVLAPYTGHPRKNWPAENWIELVNRLHAEMPATEFLIIGGPADQPAADHLVTNTSPAFCQNLCGELSFPNLLSLLQTADLFLGGDSGNTHLAAAAGVPIVSVSCHPIGADPAHVFSPARFGPWSEQATVIQPLPNPGCEAACEAHHPCCIRNVTVAIVARAALARLRVHAS